MSKYQKFTKRIAKNDAFTGKWLKFCYIDYEVRGKTIKNYEMIERTNEREDGTSSGVDVLALLKSKNYQFPKLVMIANYRAPLNKYTLGFPAGLLDGNESVEVSGLRELKEETGYTGTKIINELTSPMVYGDPWKSNEKTRVIAVEIDGDQEINNQDNIKQNLEDGESIVVHLVDIDDKLCDNLKELAQQHNYVIESKVWTFASALSLYNYLIPK